jgi:alkanesulfonate monooxygenase SsuD/methylene tetrahydromethanopterin reductase-like flavin-dependent oxidoreductase (luciferase family)
VQVWLYVAGWPGATARQLVHLAELVERYGFDGMLVAAGRRPPRAAPAASTHDGWSAMSAVARRTRRLRLGVLLPPAALTSPQRIAAAAADLDRRSAGRFELALAATRTAPHPSRLPPLPEGFTRLDETLAVLTGLWWTQPGERFTFTGRYHTVLDSPAIPAVQQPGPPLIVSGSGRRTTSYLAARWADEVNVPFRSLHHTARQYWDADDASSHDGRRHRGRPPLRRSAAVTVHSDPDLCARDALSISDDSETLAGTPQQIAAALHRYQSIGTARVYLRLPDTAERGHVDVIARRILPAMNHTMTAPPPAPPYPC